MIISIHQSGDGKDERRLKSILDDFKATGSFNPYDFVWLQKLQEFFLLEPCAELVRFLLETKGVLKKAMEGQTAKSKGTNLAQALLNKADVRKLSYDWSHWNSTYKRLHRPPSGAHVVCQNCHRVHGLAPVTYTPLPVSVSIDFEGRSDDELNKSTTSVELEEINPKAVKRAGGLKRKVEEEVGPVKKQSGKKSGKVIPPEPKRSKRSSASAAAELLHSSLFDEDSEEDDASKTNTRSTPSSSCQPCPLSEAPAKPKSFSTSRAFNYGCLCSDQHQKHFHNFSNDFESAVKALSQLIATKWFAPCLQYKTVTKKQQGNRGFEEMEKANEESRFMSFGISRQSSSSTLSGRPSSNSFSKQSSPHVRSELCPLTLRSRCN